MISLKDNSIIEIKSYGKINIKLKDVLEKQNLTRNFLARKTGTRFEVIDKWYKNNIEKMDLDVLARICYVLDCPVSEIIEFVNIPEQPKSK